MTNETLRRTKSAPRVSLSGIIAAWGHWRRKQITRRALEALSDEQLNDIGLRRVPTGQYERSYFAEPTDSRASFTKDTRVPMP